MASTYTTNIRLEKQGDGENPNSWGTILNQNVIDIIDQAIAAYTTISLSTVDVTLTTNDGTTDQARSPFLELQGTVSSSLNVIIPSLPKGYMVNNKCTYENSASVTFKTASGSGYNATEGSIFLVVCDGTSVYSLNDTSFNLSATYARLSASNTFTNTNIFTSAVDVNAPFTVSASASFTGQTDFTSAVDVNAPFTVSASASFTGQTDFTGQVVGGVTTLTDATSVAVDFSNGNQFLLQLTSAVGSSRTLENPTNTQVGQVGHIYIIQDVSTGSKTVSFGDAYKFVAGTPPTITTSVSAVDLCVFSVRGTSVVDVLVAQDLKR